MKITSKRVDCFENEALEKMYSQQSNAQQIAFHTQSLICFFMKQGQVGQKDATCGSSNECVTRPTDQPTDQRTQPVIEVLCRTLKAYLTR